ncbi:MAG: hypothetical protein AB1611_10940 [bacterium]
MKWVLYTISFLWIILGTVQILYTEKSTAALRKLMAERNPKVLAVFPFLIGFLLCLAALLNYDHVGGTSMWKPLWLVFSLGLLACIKGILFFFLPPQSTREVIQWWFYKASDRLIRLWGLILVVLGIVVISWI